MPRVNLTDAFVKSAMPTNRKLTEYSDSKERGLSLRITSAGVKSWTCRYRLKSGEQKRISLGKYEDVSLAAAREAIVKVRASIADGNDPANEVRNARQDAIEASRNTVEDAGNWYFEECEKGRHRPNARRAKRQSTIELERYYFDRQIIPHFKKQALDSVTRVNIQEFVNGLSESYSLSTARQCRIILHALFAFAQRHDIVDHNPCQYVTVAPQVARERTLTNQELITVWRAFSKPRSIKGAPVSDGVALTILLAIVTLQRRGEITGMRTDELDFSRKIWTIPSTRAKNHRAHVVPLSDLAVDLINQAISIRSIESDFIFPSPIAPDRPIEPRAMTRAFGRLRKALSMGNITPHDLRRTGTTNLTGEKLGFTRFEVSKILNHASDTGGTASVTAIYDQNEYLPNKRRALDAWANWLLDVIGSDVTC